MRRLKIPRAAKVPIFLVLDIDKNSFLPEENPQQKKKKKFQEKIIVKVHSTVGYSDRNNPE